jgi:hypothetical protein
MARNEIRVLMILMQVIVVAASLAMAQGGGAPSGRLRDSGRLVHSAVLERSF